MKKFFTALLLILSTIVLSQTNVPSSPSQYVNSPSFSKSSLPSEKINGQCTQNKLTELATDYQKTKKILVDLYKKELKDSGCGE